ncbi:MAG: hypothetical protein AB7O45_07030 [Alphaproteobacteria bacterium]
MAVNWSKVAIVTGADAGYGRLLEGLLRSLRVAERSLGASLRIHVLDFGLDAAAEAAAAEHAEIVRLDPPLPMPGGPERRAFFLSRMAKAFLPDLVPGFSAYVWLDADVWVQLPRALESVVLPLGRREFAAVPELDRAYRSLFDLTLRQHGVRARRIVRSFGRAAASQLLRLPDVNSGVVAARAGAAMWSAWQARLAQVFAIDDDPHFISDQAALNAAIFLDRVPFYPLPSTLNWCVGGTLPRIDRSGMLVTPLPPHQTIGLCHLTGIGISKPVPVQRTTGQRNDMLLDYLSVQAWRAENPPRRGAASQAAGHTRS